MAIMLNARRVHDDPQLRNDSAAWPEPWPVLELTLEDRQRWRLAAMLPNGRAVAVILPRTEHMQHGDVKVNVWWCRLPLKSCSASKLIIRLS